ncbi:hypothetical protein [Nannocystis bainbridge]|uniref:Uncharacterized protein n=1 Tax=Nannocystis bainbridge TaxID=2995303 RepID=A0ABT5E871_9BACT|nr:hypothetical protein [Nannocystis bainbridge]MDC0721610.1 hypothetical protein [Nannocystis bainbridge]
MLLACPSRPLAFVLLLAACTPAPDSGDTDTTAATAATTDPGTGTTETTGAASTDTTTGVEPDPTTTTGITTGTTTEDPTTAGTTADTTTGDTTTSGLACDLVQITTERAHVLGGEVIDCGIVDPWNNTVEEWQAAHACALEAAAAEQQFQLVVWLQGIDSDVGRGYIGTAARSYQREEIHFDTLGIPITGARPCAAFAAVDDCYDFLGTPCISCEGPSPGYEICDIP